MRLVGLALAALAAAPGGAGPEVPASDGPATVEKQPGSGGSSHTAEQARAAAAAHVDRVVEESGGVYRLADGQTGAMVDLQFERVGVVSAGELWRVHDPDQRVDRRSFFACLLFRSAGGPPEKQYDVDMLIEPREGGLAVTLVRIHKVKELEGGQWIWRTRPARQDRAAKRP